MRGDYDIEVLIFKMAAARFLDIFEEETNKTKESAIALIITKEPLFDNNSGNQMK